MVVWNLVTASVWWSAATPASCLAVDAKSGCFAVALPREPVRRWVPRQSQAEAQEDAAMSGKGAPLTGLLCSRRRSEWPSALVVWSPV